MSFTFKVNQKSLDKVESNVRDAFKKVISNNKMMGEIGKTVTDDIKFQTRRRVSIPLGSNFPALKDEKWKRLRDRVQGKHESYGKNRSNLTVTGQLLDSLKWLTSGPGKLKIYFEGTHKPYIIQKLQSWKRRAYSRKDGTRVSATTIKSNNSGNLKTGREIKNQDLASFVASQGRPFVGVRDKIKERINRIVIAYIRRAGRFFR